MPDPYLVGNGAWCSCCFPDGAPQLQHFQTVRSLARVGCNECAGQGRIAYSPDEIVERTLAEQRAWFKARKLSGALPKSHLDKT